MRKLIIALVGAISLIGCSHTVAQLDVPTVLVQGGTFTMGAKGEKDAPPHTVRLSSFYIAKYDITVAQWDTYLKWDHIAANSMEGETYTLEGTITKVSPYPTSPIQGVSWYQAIGFCNWLSRVNGLKQVYKISDVKRVQDSYLNPNTGKRVYQSSYHLEENVTWNHNANGYRLPTEAEWEFAARGGNESHGYVYAGSNDFNEVGWDIANSGGYAHPVGQKKPNELGLYDMSGDVSQWCWDWYSADYYLRSPLENPKGPNNPTYVQTPGGLFLSKVARGADWYYAHPVPITQRDSGGPSSHGVGIRVARNAK